MLSILLLMTLAAAQTLVKHCLQLDHAHPIMHNKEDAIKDVHSHFSTLPAQLMSCRVSCSEHADPRMAPLCQYMAAKRPGYPEYGTGFKFVVSGDLERCIGEQSYPSPLYNIVTVCAEQIYADEDAMLTGLHQHVTSIKINPPKPEAIDFVDGVAVIIKDLRPMSMIARVLVGGCMLGAIGLIAFCIYHFLFGDPPKP